MSRFARQSILREVGPLGQAAIERASLVLPAGLDPNVAEIARAYGEGAGLKSAVEGSVASSAPSWFPALTHEAPAQVAAGALLALSSIHGALRS